MSPSKAPEKLLWWGWALLSLLALWTYSLSWSGPFVYDDVDQIVRNSRLHDLSRIHDVIFCGTRQIRLLDNISFAIDWYWGGGASRAFHITNTILHLFNGLLLFLFLKRVFPGETKSILIALGLTLLHPLQSESVSAVMSRVSLLQSIVFLAVLNCVSRPSRFLFHLGWVIAALSPLAKESCVLIPLVVLLYYLTFQKADFSGHLLRRVAPYFISFFTLLGFAYFLRDPNVSMYKGTTGFSLFPFWTHLLVQMRNHLYIFWLMLNPTLQSIYHPFPVLTVEVWVFGLLGAVGYFFSLVFVWSGRKRYPREAFFVGLALGSLVLTNTIFQMINPFAEYRLYTANMSIFVLLGFGLVRIYERLQRPVFRFLLFALPAGYFFSFSVIQQAIWADEVKLMSASALVYPNSYHLQQSLGTAYENRGDYAEAALHFLRAKELALSDPYLKSARPSALLIQLYLRQRRYEDAKRELDWLEKQGFWSSDGMPPDFMNLKAEIAKAMGAPATP